MITHYVYALTCTFKPKMKKTYLVCKQLISCLKAHVPFHQASHEEYVKGYRDLLLEDYP